MTTTTTTTNDESDDFRLQGPSAKRVKGADIYRWVVVECSVSSWHIESHEWGIAICADPTSSKYTSTRCGASRIIGALPHLDPLSCRIFLSLPPWQTRPVTTVMSNGRKPYCAVPSSPSSTSTF